MRLILFDEETGYEIIPSEQDNEILSELNENINRLNENITVLNENLVPEEEETEEDTEEITEEITEETTQSGLVIDSSVDSHLYLSGEVQGATIDDLYSLVLSGRNILLLFGLLLIGWKLFGSLKNVIYRIMDK